jgi:hypothetical protein
MKMEKEPTVVIPVKYSLTENFQSRQLLETGKAPALDQVVDIEIVMKEALDREVIFINRDGSISIQMVPLLDCEARVTGHGFGVARAPVIELKTTGKKFEHFLLPSEALQIWRRYPAYKEAVYQVGHQNPEYVELMARHVKHLEEKEAQQREIVSRSERFLKGESPEILNLEVIESVELRTRVREELARRRIQAKEKELAEMTEWSLKYGSERLKKCASLGLIEKCGGIYADERLALECPGFRWDDSSTSKESEIRNPSLKALALLEETRQKFPDAYLCKVRPDDLVAGWSEAVRIEDLPFAIEKIAYRLV